MDDAGWILLSYRMPREPSTRRIALWRRLRRLGVVQVGDGLVALPASPRTEEHLMWAAHDAREHGGSAVLWRAHPTTQQEHDALVALAREARAAEYRAVVAAAREAVALTPAQRASTVRRLRATMREVRRRDFFPDVERDLADAALATLAATAERSPADAEVRS